MFDKLRKAFSSAAKSLGEKELNEKDIEDTVPDTGYRDDPIWCGPCRGSRTGRKGKGQCLGEQPTNPMGSPSAEIQPGRHGER